MTPLSGRVLTKYRHHFFINIDVDHCEEKKCKESGKLFGPGCRLVPNKIKSDIHMRENDFEPNKPLLFLG